jgi:disulfide bond formation protein DsbB
VRAASPVGPALMVLAAGIIALSVAFGSQHFGGLQPCELCVLQRWPWGAGILFALLAVIIAPARRGFLALAALSVAVSAGIAGFHVGVEQGWWEGLAGCSAGATPQTLDQLRALVSKAPVVRCTDIPWQAFGLSMAGWNFVAALMTAGFGALAALTPPRSRGLSSW